MFGKLCKGMENTVGIEGMVVIMVVKGMVGEAVVEVVMAMVEIMMMVLVLVVRMVEVVMKFLNCSCWC